MNKLTSIRHAKTQIDIVRMRQYRLNRVREQVKAIGAGGIVVYDPVNLRYATGSRNMQVFMLRNPGRYVYIPVEGPVTLFDFPNCEHLSAGIETIDDVREATTLSYVASGENLYDNAASWAKEIAELVSQHGGGNKKLAIDYVPAVGAIELAKQGIEVVDGQEPIEHARSIKCEQEIEAMKISVRTAEEGMIRMQEALEPGITENELWAQLHQTNIAQGGDYIETRLLNSGSRTNPWFQECSDKVIQDGELVAFDTDMNGPFGFFTDISRTFYCGDGEPTGEQKRLYQTAYEQIQTNIERLQPGMTFREYAEKSWQIPDEFFPNRYFTVAHGTGLSGEYPYIVYPQDFEEKGYDGGIEPNMVLSVESYIGSPGGKEGVKLEEQLLVTESGTENFSDFPFEPKLLK
ncbi:M24 family metallopeptidase [Salisediminibacterium halotolerans]|uniref:M24 family metallopeptidase n=1 Tax=Salisediminibacterium halotolerans TaxID=517425 RepID=UPI000F1EAA72|nr:Xaa-Pro peptidase family protein [Salisediminibacterium halotolerans]RLJ71706.1 Xaa-Pro aminopeptidase [Actinophytocola xinjiangensis]RPE86856.1 Xaa-Pro aminopeptidase [Salisediminibacterium halotolerans]TWG32919.1 Xaa-Pro aminopeptidase [Salisediminibacterium halotolerans]GEL07773.1 peptidase M24 [Salisediminibacterium halotolerans]